jgi:hypothetical protein
MTEDIKPADRYFVYQILDLREGIEVLGKKTLEYVLKAHPRTGEPLPVFRSEQDAIDFMQEVGIERAVIMSVEVAY